MRKIAVFTATRAEYGLLRPLLLRLQDSPQCSLQLLVSGTHLSPAHGYTLREIEQDGFCPAACIPMDLTSDTGTGLCTSMASLLAGLSACLETLQPDMMVLLGDRYECMVAGLAASMCHIPLAHIHGGESTEGAQDDAFRHALTKLSHWHFTSCERHRQRVIQLGEDPEKVWNVGALGVENVRATDFLPEHAVREALALDQHTPYILCTFHPVTLEQGQEITQMHELCAALRTFTEYYCIFTGANADAGGAAINALLTAECAAQPQRLRLFASLGTRLYLSAAKYAACVVGNSSSGIIEVPSLGTPVVDIGNRQQGRQRAASVLHCSAKAHDIITALRSAVSPAHKQNLKMAENPYEKNHTSASIAQVLTSYSMENICKKHFIDI